MASTTRQIRQPTSIKPPRSIPVKVTATRTSNGGHTQQQQGMRMSQSWTRERSAIPYRMTQSFTRDTQQTTASRSRGISPLMTNSFTATYNRTKRSGSQLPPSVSSCRRDEANEDWTKMAGCMVASYSGPAPLEDLSPTFELHLRKRLGALKSCLDKEEESRCSNEMDAEQVTTDSLENSPDVEANDLMLDSLNEKLESIRDEEEEELTPRINSQSNGVGDIEMRTTEPAHPDHHNNKMNSSAAAVVKSSSRRGSACSSQLSTTSSNPADGSNKKRPRSPTPSKPDSTPAKRSLQQGHSNNKAPTTKTSGGPTPKSARQPTTSTSSSSSVTTNAQKKTSSTSSNPGATKLNGTARTTPRTNESVTSKVSKAPPAPVVSAARSTTNSSSGRAASSAVSTKKTQPAVTPGKTAPPAPPAKKISSSAAPSTTNETKGKPPAKLPPSVSLNRSTSSTSKSSAPPNPRRASVSTDNTSNERRPSTSTSKPPLKTSQSSANQKSMKDAPNKTSSKETSGSRRPSSTSTSDSRRSDPRKSLNESIGSPTGNSLMVDSLNQELSTQQKCLDAQDQQIKSLERLSSQASNQLCIAHSNLEDLSQGFDAMSIVAQRMSLAAEESYCLTMELKEEARLRNCQLFELQLQLESLRDEKSRILEELTEQAISFQSDLAEINEQHSNEIKHMEDVCSQQKHEVLQNAIDEHSQEVVGLRDSHTLQLEALALEYENLLCELQQKNEEELAEIMGRDAKHLEELENRHEEKLSEMTKRFNEMKVSLNEKINSLQMECNQLKARSPSIDSSQIELEVPNDISQEKLQNEQKDELPALMTMSCMPSQSKPIRNPRVKSNRRSNYATQSIPLSNSLEYHKDVNNEDLWNELFSQQKESIKTLKAQLAEYQQLPEEINSLKIVIDMKNDEITELKKQNNELEDRVKELKDAQKQISQMQYKVENLEAIINLKSDGEKQLQDRYKQLFRKLDQESKEKKRLTMDYEELQFRLSQTEAEENQEAMPSSMTASVVMRGRNSCGGRQVPIPRDDVLLADNKSSSIKRRTLASTRELEHSIDEGVDPQDIQ